MQFIRHFVQMSGLVLAALALTVAVGYAVVTAMLLPSDRLFDILPGVEQATGGEGTDDPASADGVQGGEVSTSVSTGLGDVACRRGADEDGDGAEPFTVEVGPAVVGPDPVLVAVSLHGSDGGRHERLVELPADQAVSTAVVEDSVQGGFVGCSVVGVQQGGRVVLTGE